MRLRISVGDADVEEIYVLRVTLSLVCVSAALISITQPPQRRDWQGSRRSGSGHRERRRGN
jgi:hypothetical protein